MKLFRLMLLTVVLDVVVVRIDAQVQRVVEQISVGGHPIDAMVTEDAVWVSVQHPARVLRINP